MCACEWARAHVCVWCVWCAALFERAHRDHCFLSLCILYICIFIYSTGGGQTPAAYEGLGGSARPSNVSKPECLWFLGEGAHKLRGNVTVLYKA